MFTLTAIESCASTNDEIRSLGQVNHALLAHEQTAGRGRQGRVWQSGRGNLMLSLLLQPERPQAQWPSLSLVAGIALHQAVGIAVAKLKWPNDLWVEGAKTAGILLEAHQGLLALGVGVNITHHPDNTDTPATSLAAHGINTTPEALAQAFLITLAPLYQQWQNQGFAPLKDAWQARALPIGSPMRVRTAFGQVDGTAAGIHPDGTFLLRDTAGSLIEVSVGDVTPLAEVTL